MQEIALSPTALFKVESGGDALAASWGGKRNSVFHYIWLRDNCRCQSCGDPATGRRKLRLTDIALDIRPARTTITQAGDLEVVWPDGHISTYAPEWLWQHDYGKERRAAAAFVPALWGSETRRTPPSLEFSEVSDNSSGLLDLLHHVRDTGLCFLRHAPVQAGVLERLALMIGPVQESNFGRIQDLVVDKTKQSVANRSVALKPHTDEPYRVSPPGILMFHCIETDVQGAGSSVFMDGFEIATRLRQEDPEGFAALTQHKCSFRRHFAGDVDLIAEAPVISVDEFGNLCGIRINDRVAAPLALAQDAVPVYYRGLKRLLELAEDDDLILKVKLRPGDIAVFDNHRILHGRTELSMKGRRFLQWAQVEQNSP